MNTAAEVLLIIVSAVLSIFLVVSIVAVIKIVQVINMFKRVATQAEHLAETAEEIGEVFRKSAKPMAFGGVLANMAKTVFKQAKKKGGKDED